MLGKLVNLIKNYMGHTTNLVFDINEIDFIRNLFIEYFGEYNGTTISSTEILINIPNYPDFFKITKLSTGFNMYYKIEIFLTKSSSFITGKFDSNKFKNNSDYSELKRIIRNSFMHIKDIRRIK